MHKLTAAAFVRRIASSSSYSPTSLLRPFSTQPQWTSKWTSATTNVNSDVPFLESASRLRELCKSNLLHATDLITDPARFFEAHRILARHSVQHGPGFWIRFTVHYNLFAGTVIAVGNQHQIDQLTDIQNAGELGCFSLTEKLAGVQSGLVVQTTATYNNDTKQFVINTPTIGARKNWISQGFTADKTVVLADLIVNGKSVGPHAFIMSFREDGNLVKGIEIDDMGEKTVGNDLDNAWIHFTNVALPHSALLNKYSEVDINTGEYNVKVKGVRPFDMIGQRLYTGRVAVAQAALEFRRELFRKTKEYSDNKKTFSFQGETVLSDIPQLKALYMENEKSILEIDTFVKKCEVSLNAHLMADTSATSELVDAIATAKVLAVERSIDITFRLKQEVGSYALMDSSGFKNLDFLQCCKFAEGDSRILMQKMSRDRMKLFATNQNPATSSDRELELCGMIAAALKTGDKKVKWDDSWVEVYELAGEVMKRVQRDFD